MASLAKVVALLIGGLALYLALSALSQLDRADPTCEVPVVVEVLNGCGIRGIADKVAERLRSERFDVMFVGNADDFEYDETLVVDRSGDRNKASTIAKALGVSNIVLQVTSAFFVDVTVVVARDLAPEGS